MKCRNFYTKITYGLPPIFMSIYANVVMITFNQVQTLALSMPLPNPQLGSLATLIAKQEFYLLSHKNHPIAKGKKRNVLTQPKVSYFKRWIHTSFVFLFISRPTILCLEYLYWKSSRVEEEILFCFHQLLREREGVCYPL